MQLVAYGAIDVFMSSYEELQNMRYHNGYSTTLYKGKYKKFTGKNNFYEHLKKSDTKDRKKKTTNNHNKKQKKSQIDEYDGKNNSRYVTEINRPRYTAIFNSDTIYIEKGVYINNKRKYNNFEILFKYDEFDYYYQHISELMNKMS